MLSYQEKKSMRRQTKGSQADCHGSVRRERGCLLMETEFDVKITAGILYDYMMYHTYTKLPGIVGSVVGVLILVLYASNRQPICLIAGLVILLYLPWTLFVKSSRQALATPAFKKPLHYRLSDDGIEVSQDGTTERMDWDSMVKAVSTFASIVVYTTPVNACIFPKKDMGDARYKVIEIISTHMPPKKVKIRG